MSNFAHEQLIAIDRRGVVVRRAGIEGDRRAVGGDVVVILLAPGAALRLALLARRVRAAVPVVGVLVVLLDGAGLFLSPVGDQLLDLVVVASLDRVGRRREGVCVRDVELRPFRLGRE